MKSRFLFGLAALSLGAFASANIVLNGDFEAPETLDASGSGYIIVPTNDSTSIGGWTSGGRLGDNSVDIVSSIGLPSYPANTGTQMIDVAGSPGPGSLYQNLVTVAAQSYTLSFAASSNGNPNTMEIYWDGALLDTVVTPVQGTWQTFTYNVVASGTSTQLMFGSDLSNTSNFGPLLDTVSVVEIVPEPATGAVLLMAGVSALVRRRRK
ncbi:MAG TPA: DUF642 domain-containing protein [Fimbriimonadaceae bacterium]|nr:DUF642 domain-containing protein [Fimbriimonadaceae bacterium]